MTSHAPKVDTSIAHPARRYNYWLGGKDHYEADRESGDQIAAVFPSIRVAVQENRRFLQRAVRYLAGEVGIRQFLDIGTGIPTADNTHEVAQAVAPRSRVVYVDNDPIVLVHARALLTSTPEGATSYLEADLREPQKILRHPDLLATLDLSQPVALMLIAVLHFVPDSEDPYGIVGELTSALAPGSHLAITHGTGDFMPPATAQDVDSTVQSTNERSQAPFLLRSRDEFARFFDGLELVEPGIAPLAAWHSDRDPAGLPPAADIANWGAVARIP